MLFVALVLALTCLARVDARVPDVALPEQAGAGNVPEYLQDQDAAKRAINSLADVSPFAGGNVEDSKQARRAIPPSAIERKRQVPLEGVSKLEQIKRNMNQWRAAEAAKRNANGPAGGMPDFLREQAKRRQGQNGPAVAEDKVPASVSLPEQVRTPPVQQVDVNEDDIISVLHHEMPNPEDIEECTDGDALCEGVDCDLVIHMHNGNELHAKDFCKKTCNHECPADAEDVIPSEVKRQQEWPMSVEGDSELEQIKRSVNGPAVAAENVPEFLREQAKRSQNGPAVAGENVPEQAQAQEIELDEDEVIRMLDHDMPNPEDIGECTDADALCESVDDCDLVIHMHNGKELHAKDFCKKKCNDECGADAE